MVKSPYQAKVSHILKHTTAPADWLSPTFKADTPASGGKKNGLVAIHLFWSLLEANRAHGGDALSSCLD
ncbi:hypothetical protein PGTUg99_035237 [Puccinia graminis f. sp. tritici]|uniref:Uncharacterized protein n=1 Tax=Puccinia graminis f. sp. tritici TaxID=56615 RepID=A0A5B0RB24_PUCGR|nr:hypothetical protein PGTUg99_035237 [Puccinia graminis f. sp. tritici]